jgi:hypothetical protein
MPDARKTKQTGYDVTIKAFVPADMSDMTTLAKVQDARSKSVQAIEAVGGKVDSLTPTITPTRR